jgi:hypothetical protein
LFVAVIPSRPKRFNKLAGFMYFWGLTLSAVTSNILIISVGLSIDFAAHIGIDISPSHEMEEMKKITRLPNIYQYYALYSNGYFFRMSKCYLAKEPMIYENRKSLYCKSESKKIILEYILSEL